MRLLQQSINCAPGLFFFFSVAFYHQPMELSSSVLPPQIYWCTVFFLSSIFKLLPYTPVIKYYSTHLDGKCNIKSTVWKSADISNLVRDTKKSKTVWRTRRLWQRKNNAVLQNSVKNKNLWRNNRDSERKAFLGEKLS